MNGNYLITTNDWFTAPDGNQYNSVWGNVEIMTDDFLGVKTNRHAVNWFAKVGTAESHIIIAGCQIHYAVKCKKPTATKAIHWGEHEGKYFEYERPVRYYIFENEQKTERMDLG